MNKVVTFLKKLHVGFVFNSILEEEEMGHSI